MNQLKPIPWIPVPGILLLSPDKHPKTESINAVEINYSLFGLKSMSETVKKLSFEDMDFKFKAAYGQYIEKFESAHTDERRNELNEAITQLYSEDISYPDYYSIIDKETDDRYRFHRSKINTTRKYAYRKKQQKKNRIDRHK